MSQRKISDLFSRKPPNPASVDSTPNIEESQPSTSSSCQDSSLNFSSKDEKE